MTVDSVLKWRENWHSRYNRRADVIQLTIVLEIGGNLRCGETSAHVQLVRNQL